MALDMEKVGIAFANHALMIFAVAQTYNILQKQN